MKHATTIATGSLLASVATAASGVVTWDIAKRGGKLPTKISKRASSDTVTEIIDNKFQLGGYFATVTVGTPPQNLTLQLDTGSSDIWVPSTEACEALESSSSSSSGKCNLGSYEHNNSDSYELVNHDFDISYVDGSSSRGDYITETFAIGDVSLTNVTMGNADTTDIPYGLVGVGYKTNEAAPTVYDNLPVVMYNEGRINTIAYSLWLNDLDSSTGSIMFGGIDTDKYKGDLIRVDVQPDPRYTTKTITSFMVQLSGVTAHSSSGDDSLGGTFPVSVVLDSGTTLSYLPTELADEIYNEVGAQFYQGFPLVPCSLADKEGYFAFAFGGKDGPVIQVGLDELVLDAGLGTFPSGQYEGEQACEFGIFNTTEAPYLLGDTFLRSAYVVYDLENNEVGLANTDFNATSSKIVAFSSQGAPIPSSTAAPNQDDVASTGGNSDNAGSGFQSGGSSSGTGDDSGAMSLSAMTWTQMVTIGATMSFMMVGGAFSILF
ncbi:aspartic peptidase domain-containing protein [Xylariaceae sp. FL1019]|nr:aspartic peptidase domain-containing protein [Xylariaceae sp. FL1019]